MKNTRAIIDAIHDGSLANEEMENFPVFNMSIPKNVKGCDSSILNPRNAWADQVFPYLLMKKIRLSMTVI